MATDIIIMIYDKILRHKTEMYAKNFIYICFEYIYLAYIFFKYIIVINQMIIDLYGGLLSQKIQIFSFLFLC